MKPRTFSILSLAAAVAGLTGVYVLVVAQASQQRHAIETQIAAKQRAAAEMRQATAGAGDVRIQVADLSQAVASVEARIVPEHDLDRVVRDIWNTADADSLQTQMVQPLPICQRGAYCEQPVEIQVTGGFEAFYSFVLQLERLPRLVRITHMDLHRLAGSAASEGGMTARLTIGIYYRPNTGQTDESIGASATAAIIPP
jgi:type IV pilus assembly protein PilO